MTRTVAEALFEAYAAEHFPEQFAQLVRCEDGYVHHGARAALLTRGNDITERYTIENFGYRHTFLLAGDGGNSIDRARAFLCSLIQYRRAA